MERFYSFGRPISKTTALKLSSEAWVLKKRGEQRLEVTQIKFLGHLLGINKLYGGRNQFVKDKLGVQNIFREIQKYERKWLQLLHRESTETGYQAGPAVSNKKEEKHRTPEEKMEGPNVPRGSRKRH
jgi:hypothetical protein